MDTLNNQRVEFWERWHGDQSSNLFKDTIACLNGLLARRSFKNPRSFLLSSSTIVCIWDSSQTIWFIQWFIGIYNNHYKDAYYGWDDHQPYSEYWPWLIWQLWIVIPFRWSIDYPGGHVGFASLDCPISWDWSLGKVSATATLSRNDLSSLMEQWGEPLTPSLIVFQ